MSGWCVFLYVCHPLSASFNQRPLDFHQTFYAIDTFPVVLSLELPIL